MRAPTRHALALLLVLSAMPALARAAAPDHSLWQQLLQRYARQVSAKGQPIETRFDYEQLYVDEKIWISRESGVLAKVREQMFAVDPATLSDADRKAWAVNAYNFLVVERATLKLLVPNRRFLRYRSVNEMIYTDGNFFEAKVVTLGGQQYSIADFERAFVQGDPVQLPEPRSRAADPRLSFATCPGSVGGPTLWLRAFRGDSLEAQLDRVTCNALSEPRWVRVSAKKDDIEVSDALFTRRFDMGGDGAGIIRFLEKQGSKDAQAVIRKYKLTAPPRYMLYDWQLNQVERQKGAAPQGIAADSTRKS